MKRVILCPNPYRDKGLAAAKEAEEILRGVGLETVYCLPFRPEGGEEQFGVPCRPLQQELRNSDLVLAFGGLLLTPLQRILQSEALQPAFSNVVPALFGAMAYKYYRNHMNIAVAPLVLMSLLFILAVPRIVGGTPGQKGVWRYTMGFPNVGYIGYPVAVALFGQGAMFYAAVLALPFNLLTFTLGPLMLGGGARFHWKQVVSPCTCASVLALFLALARLRPPALIGEMLDFVGDLTVPLALVLVGSLLAGLPMKRMLGGARVCVLSLVRLLVMPAALWLVLRNLSIDPMVMGIAVTQMAMPTAINGTILCMAYGGDSEAMAQITFMTTLASIVTIPLVAAMLL